MIDELFDVVDETGRVIGRRPRSECHRNPALIHQAVHLFVFDGQERLFLQKRAMTKDIQPGKWDLSVGGHLQPGETPDAAVRREAAEELGLDEVQPRFAYTYLWRSERETERITTFWTFNDGPFRLQAEEIETGRFWTFDEIRRVVGRGVLTPNFEDEFRRWQAFCASGKPAGGAS